MLESFQHAGQMRAIGEIDPLLLPAAIQTRIMVSRHHGSWETLHQFHIPLLTGNHQNLLKRQLPAQ